MFFRRRKQEGFKWHDYVRTTIQLRREQRRARLDEIGRAAAGQVKAVGDAAMQGVAHVAGQGWRTTAAAWRNSIAQPAVTLPVTLIGGMALLSGIYRAATVAADGDALLPLSIGIIALALVAPLALPAWSRRGAIRLQSIWHRLPTARLFSAALIATSMIGLGWFGWGSRLPIFAPASSGLATGSVSAGAAALEGHAVALSGEMIRLQGQLLHLSGIEAPDRQQTCTRADKQWRCGEAALAALEKLSRKHVFHCELQGAPDATGRIEANCSVDGRDVASELVKEGHVFSTATYFGGYAALETEARLAGNGLWSGDAERPAAYRAKIWDAAKASAPDGCPIKGQISGSRHVYVMPWSPHYAKASVRSGKGERWFCSEAEAQAAGYKAVSDRAVASR